MDAGRARKRRDPKPRGRRQRQHRGAVRRSVGHGRKRPAPASARSGTTRSRRPTSIRTTTTDVEVGVKFRSDVAGFVTGVRFYKGPTNTGTHAAHLWTSARSPARTVTFTGETASGWQQGHFAAPIPISANTTYIIVVPHAGRPVRARRASTSVRRSTAAHSTPLRTASDGPNGVYLYGAAAFPDGHVQQDQLLGRHRLLDLRRGPTRRLRRRLGRAPSTARALSPPRRTRRRLSTSRSTHRP